MRHKKPSIIVCPYCDSLSQPPMLAAGQKMRCPCCRVTLVKHSRLTPAHVLALCITGLVLLFIANYWPVFSASLSGVGSQSTLFGIVYLTWMLGSPFAAVAALVALFVVPLCELLLLGWLCLFATLGGIAPGARVLLRLLHHLKPWAMIEVWVLGIIVAVVKLRSVFDLHVENGAWAFAGLMFILIWVMSWDRQALLARTEDGYATV